MTFIVSILNQSLILGIMVLGVYITYSLLDFPDLTIDGSFTLGACITATMLVKGYNPIICLMIAGTLGAIAGLMTSLLNTKFKISSLLSGILMMGVLYTCNLRLLGKPNIALFNLNHLFNKGISPIWITLGALIIVKLALDTFLKTNLGYYLKGCGMNKTMLQGLGIHPDKIQAIGLMLGNSLAAIAGALMAQYQGFTDISMGNGSLIIGIAAIIMGQSALKYLKVNPSTKVIIGMIGYQGAIAMTLNFGFYPSDLKLITTLIVLGFICIGQMKCEKTSKLFRNLKANSLNKLEKEATY